MNIVCRFIRQVVMLAAMGLSVTAFASTDEPPVQGPRWACWYAPSNLTVQCLLSQVPTVGLDAVLVAAELVLETGAVSAEHVLNVIGRLNASAPPEQVETALRLNEAPRADTGRYDGLRDQADQEVGHA